VTGVEWLVKTVWRMWEESKISRFLQEAKEHYERERSLANAQPVSHNNPLHVEYEPNLDPRLGGFIHDVAAFKTFFERGCEASPVIPMLTLNSGVCGSLITLLQLFHGREDAMVSEETFGAGAEYFLRLKEFGRNYLKSSGFKFTSLQPSVQRYLSHAVTHHTRVKALTSKVLVAAAAS
jgi:hypothetical protein